MSTKIEWVRNPDGTAGETWNPVVGCSKVSPGCERCYAERMDRRQMMPGRKDGFRPWTAQNAEYNVRLHPERLEQPSKWKKPRRVFVCSMSDLFHEQVPTHFIADVWAIMKKTTHHTFQILTKRPQRMQAWLRTGDEPLSNVWLLVSAEDQKTFDERARWLLQTPAAVRGVSLEPLLGPVNVEPAMQYEPFHENYKMTFTAKEWRGLDWVIAGGESGPGARPMHPEWVRSIRDQCQAAGVAFFLKQRGEFMPMPEAKARRLRWTQRVCVMASGAFYPEWMCRVGKKAAGRVLDGRTWDEFPEVQP